MYLSILLDIVLEDSSFKITLIKNFSFLLICDPIPVDRKQNPSRYIPAVPIQDLRLAFNTHCTTVYSSDSKISVNNASNNLHLTCELFASECLWNSHVDYDSLGINF